MEYSESVRLALGRRPRTVRATGAWTLVRRKSLSISSDDDVAAWWFCRRCLRARRIRLSMITSSNGSTIIRTNHAIVPTADATTKVKMSWSRFFVVNFLRGINGIWIGRVCAYIGSYRWLAGWEIDNFWHKSTILQISYLFHPFFQSRRRLELAIALKVNLHTHEDSFLVSVSLFEGKYLSQIERILYFFPRIQS